MRKRWYFVFFTLILLNSVCGCRGKKNTKFPPPFYAPKEIKIEYSKEVETEKREKLIAQIYYDNTLSQMGYYQNERYEFDANAKVSAFFRAVTNQAVVVNYKPLYYVLKEQEEGAEKFLNWTNIEMGEMTPFTKSFYTTKGSNHHLQKRIYL